MSEKLKDSPLKEQKICVTCGFCCDGTLFNHAVLEPGEKGILPDNIKLNYSKEKDKEYFKQPCLCFNEKCTIYNKKPNVCSSFRCQLLKNYSNNKISQEEAVELIRHSKQTRTDLFREFIRISGKREASHFWELLVELGKMQKQEIKDASRSFQLDIFTAKCNIFESLLIKHFKSEQNFNEMIETHERLNNE